MKKIVKLTESDLTNIVKRVIMEGHSEDEDFNLDKPFITYRQIVQSILSDIKSLGRSNTKRISIDPTLELRVINNFSKRFESSQL